MTNPIASVRGSADTSNLDCSNSIDQRNLTNQMEEALDTEVGRLLVATGLASRGQNGQQRSKCQGSAGGIFLEMPLNKVNRNKRCGEAQRNHKNPGWRFPNRWLGVGSSFRSSGRLLATA